MKLERIIADQAKRMKDTEGYVLIDVRSNLAMRVGVAK